MNSVKHVLLGLSTLVVLSAAGLPASAEPPARFTGTDGADMALVPSGSFVMGSDDEDLSGLAPIHEVHLDAFYMDVHEVTNAQFARFLDEVKPQEGINGRRWQWVVLRSDLDYDERADWWPTEILFERDAYAAFPGFEKHPVMSVSWEAAQQYCHWAGKRLPTEAEWEKAARGGLKEKDFPWGDAIPINQGVVFGRRWQDNGSPPPTAPVGSYHPNGYGLYDMAGNVWEWCSDWFEPTYYFDSPVKNPTGPLAGMEKVVRGGSWYNAEMVLRVGLRNFNSPDALDESTGFRCARNAEEGRP